MYGHTYTHTSTKLNPRLASLPPVEPTPRQSSKHIQYHSVSVSQQCRAVSIQPWKKACRKLVVEGTHKHPLLHIAITAVQLLRAWGEWSNACYANNMQRYRMHAYTPVGARQHHDTPAALHPHTHTRAAVLVCIKDTLHVYYFICSDFQTGNAAHIPPVCLAEGATHVLCPSGGSPSPPPHTTTTNTPLLSKRHTYTNIMHTQTYTHTYTRNATASTHCRGGGKCGAVCVFSC